MPTIHETQVLIIGAGATGTGVARDLALRGVHCIVVEQRDVNAGASGANHGLLHSGGRYVGGDAASATHCHQEGELLRRLAPHCVEDTQGLFVAVQGDDERYVASFPDLCAKCGVPACPLDLAEARHLEPSLSPKLIAVYEVQDGSIDPFKLSLDNMAHAASLGSRLLTESQVVGFEREGNRITETRLVNRRTGEPLAVRAQQIVNASGAWSDRLAALAGVSLKLIYSKGTLLITQHRVTRRVVNRLRKASNADIIVPGGTVSVLGTTSVRIDSLDSIAPTVPEVDLIMDETSVMVPALAHTRIMRAYAGVRPLVDHGPAADDRAVSRDLALIDHGRDGVDNLITITGGKLTTFRHMAEKTADMVCGHLGVTASCRTREVPLPAHCPWTVPGHSPRTWLSAGNREDSLLCECEMVPQSAVNHIVQHILDKRMEPSLQEIGLRSRMGKGSCQGAFCGLRALAHLYEQGELEQAQGLGHLRAFLDQRWKGQQGVLWGTQLGQAELTEAMHCGFLGLELGAEAATGERR